MEGFIWNIFLIFTTKIKLWMYKWTYFDVDFQFNVKSLSYMVDSSLVEVNTKFSPLLTSDILRRPQNLKKNSTFLTLLSNLKKNDRVFSNFVAFSQYMWTLHTRISWFLLHICLKIVVLYYGYCMYNLSSRSDADLFENCKVVYGSRCHNVFSKAVEGLGTL